MRTTQVSAVYSSTGPFAAVTTDVSHGSEHGEHEHELRVRSASESLSGAGRRRRRGGPGRCAAR